MTSIYYERDADTGILDVQRVAVVGYGNQGRSWALNLRDSGYAPVICVRRDETREQAIADGFEAHDVEAANDADIICILVPDDVITLLPLAPRADSCVIVASGYTLGFGRLDPPGDSGMVAPRMLAPVLAIAKAIGGLRQGALALTPMQEAVLDLGVEQVLSPALTAVNNAFVQTMIEHD